MQIHITAFVQWQVPVAGRPAAADAPGRGPGSHLLPVHHAPRYPTEVSQDQGTQFSKVIKTEFRGGIWYLIRKVLSR